MSDTHKFGMNNSNIETTMPKAVEVNPPPPPQEQYILVTTICMTSVPFSKLIQCSASMSLSFLAGPAPDQSS